MRVLLDTQAVIWYVDQDHLLSPAAHAGITDPNNDLLLSAATLWEVAIKEMVMREASPGGAQEGGNGLQIGVNELS